MADILSEEQEGSSKPTAPEVGIPPLQADEEIKMRVDGVRLRKGKVELDHGVGSLFITTKRVIWGVPQPGQPLNPEISFTYYEYVFHAKTEPPMHAILIQLLASKPEEAPATEEEEDEDVDETKLWFFPSTEAQLEPLFQAISECSSLNPDLEFGEEGGENEMFVASDGDEDLDYKRLAPESLGADEDHKQPRMSRPGEDDEDDPTIYADSEHPPAPSS